MFRSDFPCPICKLPRGIRIDRFKFLTPGKILKVFCCFMQRIRIFHYVYPTERYKTPNPYCQNLKPVDSSINQSRHSLSQNQYKDRSPLLNASFLERRLEETPPIVPRYSFCNRSPVILISCQPRGYRKFSNILGILVSFPANANPPLR